MTDTIHLGEVMDAVDSGNLRVADGKRLVQLKPGKEFNRLLDELDAMAGKHRIDREPEWFNAGVAALLMTGIVAPYRDKSGIVLVRTPGDRHAA